MYFYLPVRHTDAFDDKNAPLIPSPILSHISYLIPYPILFHILSYAICYLIPYLSYPISYLIPYSILCHRLSYPISYPISYLIRPHSTVARDVRLVRPHRAPRGGGAKIVLIKKSIPLVNYSFLCMLKFWQRLLSMIDKVSKSLQSKDISTIGQLLGCLNVKK